MADIFGKHTDFYYTPIKGDRHHIVANDRRHAINILRKCYIKRSDWTASTNKEGITEFVEKGGVIFATMKEGTTWIPSKRRT